jgi:hypothetical protein
MRNDDRICESDAKYELARRSLALGKVTRRVLGAVAVAAPITDH